MVSAQSFRAGAASLLREKHVPVIEGHVDERVRTEHDFVAVELHEKALVVPCPKGAWVTVNVWVPTAVAREHIPKPAKDE